jgi:hypothetical protein
MRVTSATGPGKGHFLIFLQTTAVSPTVHSDLGTSRVTDYPMQAAIVPTVVVHLSSKVTGKFVIWVTGNERDRCLHFHPLHLLREMADRRTLRQERIESVRQPGVKDVLKMVPDLRDVSLPIDLMPKELQRLLNWIMSGDRKCARILQLLKNQHPLGNPVAHHHLRPHLFLPSDLN